MQYLKKIAAAVAVVTMILGSCISASAQMPAPTLGVDSALRMGKLPNGLTYYIRHNERPKGQADFYIAQNVGSILEEDNQRGLAHFLEHMCFNGTTHFPGSSLRDWLESIGVKFGANLNAYTSIDETVYNIANVPVARETVQDSCLLILHDWANDLTLDPEEIDKERGVIHQEWRRSMQGQMRILENILPDIYPTTKYGHRLPIGTMEVVDNFPPQALRDYYEKWYRPDQQAIIVVGDIDVDRIEGKIKEIFADIEMPADAPERVYEPVPDHQGTLYGIGSDPEQKNLIASISWLSEHPSRELKNTPQYVMADFMQDLIAMMLNNRLDELGSKPDTPFAGASVDFGGFFVSDKVKDAFEANVVSKSNDIIVPLQSVYREVLRAVRGGFTQGEYERARDEALSQLEKRYNNRKTRENGQFVNQYVKNFTSGDNLADIEEIRAVINQIVPVLNVQMLNQVFAADFDTQNNRVVMVLSPEGEGIVVPTKDDIAAALAAVEAEEIAAFVDEVKAEPLVPAEPVAGTIVATQENPTLGTTEWTLSNGAKVVVKQTAFKDDEIRFGAYSPRGFSAFPSEFDTTILTLPLTMQGNGLGTYSSTDVDKYLAGKQASVNANFNSYSSRLGGSTTPKDLPTLMELIYMTMSDIEFTAEEFEALQKAYAGYLANQEKSPDFVFNKNVLESLYTNPRYHMVTSSDFEKTSREKTIELAHNLTDNAAEWTFAFVGNVDPATLKPLVEKYIASLPGNPATALKQNVYSEADFMAGGDKTDTFTLAMATPQTSVFIMESADIPYNQKNRLAASIAGQILTKRLIASVREDMGAVYSIGARGALAQTGLRNAKMSLQFPMKPELKDQVLTHIRGQIADMQTNIADDELNPVKEYMAKSFTEGKEKNEAWMAAILDMAVDGIDTFTTNVEDVNAITADDIKAFMKTLNDAGNYRVVILDPAE